MSNEAKVSASLVPSGSLLQLDPTDVVPNPENPRILFDAEPMRHLLDNIRVHGVLVPITVYKLPAQSKFGILDGARRHHCCLQLLEEGRSLTIPANVVSPPDQVAGLLAMFSIHNLREQWELMPTALSLQILMDGLGETDSKKLASLTGMSEPQVERCKLLLKIPKRFQDLSLLPDPEKRIPANLWIESSPVWRLVEEHLPDLAEEIGNEGYFESIAGKYEAGAVKSVIHFRRIVESFDRHEADDERLQEVTEALQTFVVDREAETRRLFDPFVTDDRRVDSIISACDTFVKALNRQRPAMSLERRDEIVSALQFVRAEIGKHLTALEGRDAPSKPKAREKA